MVLEMVRRGRLVLIIGDQEFKNTSKKTIMLKYTQNRWFS
jgi:hypothetical protein